MPNHNEVLNNVYEEALQAVAADDMSTVLQDAVKEHVELIASRSEANKGLVAVLTTLLTHKVVEPQQDVRYHQANLPNGF